MDARLLDSVKEYIRNLSSETERSRIIQYLERQGELGPILKEPISKPLISGINEVRPGPHRLLFFYHRRCIVVLHAFRKKSRKTPYSEIRRAVKAEKEYLVGEAR